MKTKRFDWNYKPLKVLKSIEVIGSVPTSQQYDAVAEEWTPDYTLVNLILQPHVSIVDPDSILVNGEVTWCLTNIKWTEIKVIGNTTTNTVISGTTEGYALELGGMNAGRLRVQKNVVVGEYVTYRFEADYVDTRTQQVHHITEEKCVECVNATSSPPKLILDSPETVVYNPWRDSKDITIHAKLMHGQKEVGVLNRTIAWEKKRSNGSWSAIGSDLTDQGFSVSSDGGTFTQDMDLMGDRLDLRIRGNYDNGGKERIGYLTLIRRLPDYEYDIHDVPENIEPDTEQVFPRAVITDRHGVIVNPEKELFLKWYVAAGVAAGNPTFELVNHGEYAGISTEKINNNGMIIGLEPEDRGARKIVTWDGKAVVYGNRLVTDR